MVGTILIWAAISTHDLIGLLGLLIMAYCANMIRVGLNRRRTDSYHPIVTRPNVSQTQNIHIEKVEVNHYNDRVQQVIVENPDLEPLEQWVEIAKRRSQLKEGEQMSDRVEEVRVVRKRKRR